MCTVAACKRGEEGVQQRVCQRGILVPGGKDGSASRNTSEHKGYIFSKLCLADKRGTRAAKCLRGVESFFLFLERGGKGGTSTAQGSQRVLEKTGRGTARRSASERARAGGGRGGGGCDRFKRTSWKNLLRKKKYKEKPGNASVSFQMMRATMRACGTEAAGQLKNSPRRLQPAGSKAKQAVQS